MKIDPYKLHPVPPRMGVLVDGEHAFVEGEGELSLEAVPPDVRVHASGELVSELLAGGEGEALTWNNEPIRWRPRSNAAGWRNAPSDVRVLWLPFPELAGDTLEGFCTWRDWLAHYRAAPLGSLGSSAYSLLRATLAETLWTSVGERPPIRWTLGGRQELGPAGAGLHAGELEHYDLPAAYASVLGELRYGGWWHEVDAAFPFQRAHERGMLVYVNARVKVPELAFGPLPRRPRSQPRLWEGVLWPVEYPTRCRLQGTWVWDELAAALEAGCTIEHVRRVWIHVTGDEGMRPFGPWWAAVQEGRRMRGFAGLLAKATGNALWGQFCIRADGWRSLVRYRRRRGRVVREQVAVPVYGSRPGSPDLAELVTGKVRAELGRFLNAAGEKVLAAHTDGVWVRELGYRPAGWRLDDRAESMFLLGPQMLRYRRPGEPEPVYVVSGVPERLAPDSFAAAWDEHIERGLAA